MIFDTHIHLNDEAIFNNLEENLTTAINNGVKSFLCVGFDIESSKKAIEIANRYKEVYAAIGIIPTEHKQYNEHSIDELRELLKTSNKIVAIGEIGLDYYWEKEESIKERQQEMFINQIKLANEFNLPISIHCREAYADTLSILKEYKVINKGIMHCYSGSLESAKEFIKLGFLLAFGGVLTFKNAVKTKEVIQGIELKDIVFETDAPYLAPTPYRGKINLPVYIVETVKYASSLLNIEQNELERITYENSCRILKLNQKISFKELIVVEGKTDIDWLSSFINADFYSVNGSAINEKDINYLRKISTTRDIIVLTDPDYPGKRIRTYINEKIKNIKNAYVRKEFSIKNHKVGVAEASKEEILKALSNIKQYNKDLKSDLTMNDLFELKLNGYKNSKNLRLEICNYMQIEYLNAKQLLNKMKMLGLNKIDLMEILDDANRKRN